jgi:predicted RNase H-like HicB family nuclease
MSTPPHRPTGAEQARWFGRRAPAGAAAHKEMVTAGDASFQAVFRRSQDGGYVVSLPALPHLMTRGATYQHARIKAVALVHGYMRELRAQGCLAGLPLRLPREERALAA